MSNETQHDLLTEIEYEGPYGGYTIANPWERFIAVIIEGLIVYLPINWFVVPNFYLTDDSNYFDIIDNLIQVAIAAGLGAIFYSLWSCNLGHKIIGLKVISATDFSDKKDGVAGAVREALKGISSWFIIPSIWLLWDNRKQNLYDKITNTLVVKANSRG